MKNAIKGKKKKKKSFYMSFLSPLFAAKQVIELGGSQQTTFTDLVTQLGLASSLRPEGQYTLLVPQNRAFSGW